MDNQTLMYIVVGVLVLFFIFLTVFNVKTWRWLHVMCAFLVFLAAGVFVFLTAATLKTHEAWATVANKLNADVAEKQLTAKELQRGQIADENGKLVEIANDVAAAQDSLAGVEAALQRVILDRGRVYRGATPQIADGDSILVTLVETPAAAPVDGDDVVVPPAEVAEPDVDEPAEPEAPPVATGRHTIEVNTVVHVFGEGPSEIEGELNGFTVPRAYLGEFVVTNRDDRTITIRPTIPSNPRQVAEIQAGGTWAVYTKMPVDTHFAFEGLDEAQLRALFPKERMTISDEEYQERINQLANYFEDLTPEQLAAQIPKDKVLMSDAAYENFIASYAKDLEEGDASTMPSERLWMEVTFLTDYEVAVDEVVDEGAPSEFQSEHFNVRGLAVDPQLKHGETITFEIGDTAIFDPMTVKSKELIENGIIDKDSIRYVYVRQLRDYEQYFNDRYRQELVFADNANVIKADTAVLVAANVKATEQETFRQQEKALLSADLAGFQRQNSALDTLQAKLESTKNSINGRLNALFRGNLELAARIRSYQFQLAAEVNRAIEAEEASPPSTPAPSGAVSAP